MFAAFVSILYPASFWLLVFLIVLQIYILVFNKGVPNIRTAPAIRKKVIEILKRDFAARRKKNYTIIDLGSGNGLFTREIARALPGARVIGIETSPQQFTWATKLKRRCRLANLHYEKADFLARDLADADAVVMYLVSYLMEKVGCKLHKDLKKDALIVSNRFRLGDGWKPQKTIKVSTLYPHQKKVHVYRKK